MCVAKTNVLIGFAVTAKLVCALVCAEADGWCSDERLNYTFLFMSIYVE